jgi:hypothetical protein
MPPRAICVDGYAARLAHWACGRDPVGLLAKSHTTTEKAKYTTPYVLPVFIASEGIAMMISL